MISVSREPRKVTIQTRTFYIPLQSLPLIKHSEILFTALAIPVDNYLEGFEREKQQRHSKTFPVLYILLGVKITLKCFLWCLKSLKCVNLCIGIITLESQVEFFANSFLFYLDFKDLLAKLKVIKRLRKGDNCRNCQSAKPRSAKTNAGPGGGKGGGLGGCRGVEISKRRYLGQLYGTTLQNSGH